jgi:LuxR family maltose regulon positive regulatory protein
VDRTEGWAVGLRMAALTMQDQDDYPAFVASFQGSHRLVTTYLLDEVFARQPQVIRTFLLRTSILERLCAPLCNAVVYVEAGGGGRKTRSRRKCFFTRRAQMVTTGSL